jgi:hypothetical protein
MQRGNLEHTEGNERIILGRILGKHCVDGTGTGWCPTKGFHIRSVQLSGSQAGDVTYFNVIKHILNKK